ncbi:MinD/ParA family protein [Ferrimonas balearica]|uniref:MinD/ParA family ATP-binding protein n=1 Tax=Ferrimonas balearica TaxID=44012 RepID=UPI001C990D3C|nr:AAA family ATPase [Ferrimonas balearica]MBY5921729.1 AAA family ATPase [Ferrimonas balearica]MBY5994931.1 AAA family ATPase [Ferrimonas balearica]
MNLKDLIDNIGKAFDIELGYLHPKMYLFVLSDEFYLQDEDLKLNILSAKSNVDLNVIHEAMSVKSLGIECITKQDRLSRFSFIPDVSMSSHWVSALSNRYRKQDTFTLDSQSKVRAIHFYGYKGGQARSSFLSVLAKSIAKDGYKVLVVDSDIEAPSSDTMFGIEASTLANTLMGVCGWSDQIEPLRAFTPISTDGKVDVISCRPSPVDYDLDFAAFTSKVAINPNVIVDGIKVLRDYCETDDKYNVVLFDHRTGLSSSVIPIISKWPGSSVINIRMDGLSLSARSIYDVLFSYNKDYPGCYVNFSLDPEDSESSVISKHGNEIDELLSTLADQISSDDEEELLNEEILNQYWINWYHDRAFFSKSCPDPEDLHVDNRNSISKFRLLLGIDTAIEGSINQFVIDEQELSLSGALDSGLFIETSMVTQSFRLDSPFNYIHGRKGTGKTRLFAELCRRDNGIALLSSTDNDMGISAPSSEFHELMDLVDNDNDKFWWALLTIGMISNGKIEKDAISSLKENIKSGVYSDDFSSSYGFKRFLIGSYSGAKKSFYIDGVETAVDSSKTNLFVESLLRFMNMVETDNDIKRYVSVRLFIRTDLLLSNSKQNIEQQISGRSLELKWDEKSILNFLLSRIYARDIFARHFKNATDDIKNNIGRIREAGLSIDECKKILLKIFPNKLRRSNILTLTFFSSYFSDAAGASDSTSSFYPRLFETFLDNIEKRIQDSFETTIVDERLSHSVIIESHADASKKFIKEVEQELAYVIDYGESHDKAKDFVNSLINELAGKTTPFDPNELSKEIHNNMSHGSESQVIKNALVKMKSMGIFEDRPKYPGMWRAGGLYKSALKMKFKR